MALGLGRSKMMVPYNKTRTCNCINLFEYINLKKCNNYVFLHAQVAKSPIHDG